LKGWCDFIVGKEKEKRNWTRGNRESRVGKSSQRGEGCWRKLRRGFGRGLRKYGIRDAWEIRKRITILGLANDCSGFSIHVGRISDTIGMKVPVRGRKKNWGKKKTLY